MKARYLAVGILGLGLLAIPVTSAFAADTCNTATTTLNNRPDSGFGGNDWALDNLTRKTVICETTAGHYSATVTDSGTFTTNAGKSPANATDIAAGIKGEVNGGFSATFTAPAGFAGYQGNFNNTSYNGTAPSSSQDWVKNVWGGQGFESVTNLVGWKWTYTTCSETWVNAEESTGDITGKPCPSKSPSASPTPSASSTTPVENAPAPTPVTANLPVTG